MRKKNVALIGKGKWGFIIKKKLNKISNIVYFEGRNYQNKSYDGLDWVFIVTPDHTHEKIINYFLKKKINIFCEKPIIRDYKKAKILLDKFKKKKQKIYISDVLFYLKNKPKLKKNNTIIRSKKGNYNINDILYKLAYHDFYYCFKIFQKANLKIFKKYEEGKLYLVIQNKDFRFKFIYDTSDKQKKHLYNGHRISYGQDPLNEMLNNILYKKPNFLENHKRSLYSLKLIQKILLK